MWDEKLFKDTLLQRSSTYLVREEKPFAFAQAIALQHREIDFTNYLLRFIELNDQYLTRLRAKKRNETLHFVECIEYFAHLDDLYAKSPEVALRIIMMIVALDNYGFNSEAFIEVNHRLLNWIQDEDLPIKSRFEISYSLWKSIPISSAHFNEKELIPFLMAASLILAKDDTEYIVSNLNISDDGEMRSELFSKVVENPLDFLQFARDVQAYKPKLVTNALLNCLFEGRCYRHALKMQTKFRFALTEQQLIAICYELFDKLQQGEREEHICQNLIKDMPPNELLYPKLFEKLWQIERAKPKNDEQTINNCFLVVMNAETNTSMYAEAKEKIEIWAISYEVLYQQGHDTQTRVDWLFWLEDGDQSKCGLMVAHAKKLLDSIDEAMSMLWPKTRNLSLPVPQSHEVMTQLVNTYWLMLEWLLTKNQYVALRVLVVGFQTNEDYHTNSSLTNQVSQQALSRFMQIFEQYHKTNIHETALLMEHIINLSLYSNYRKRLGKLLDEIFPMFELIAPNEAQSAYERAHKNDGSHSYGWYYHRKKM